MRNPQGNLICGEGRWNENADGSKSGPWGVTCGYWRCTDDRCCIRDGEPEKYHMERNTGTIAEQALNPPKTPIKDTGDEDASA